MKKGIVYLVGAGPGDEGLITSKALDCISNADVVVYDELANAALLKNARADAELIYVGKKGGDHTVPQDETQRMLVGFANEGKTVCRLKGGDPFVFGRGGEEVVELAEHGISCQVVPGITSAIAAPAYAGIPVTQRGFTSGVAFFTGHEDPTKESSDLNWESIANLQTTLVFLMGMKNLPLIVENLIKHGMRDDMPVAVVHRGTTPLQRTVTGTLANIAARVKEARIGAPSVIVVGKVVDLRETAPWFESRPLFGKRVLVTRTRKQASSLVTQLRDQGAATFEFPTIEITPNEEAYAKLDASIAEMSTYDWLIFTSANGVEIFMQRLKALGLDGRKFGTTHVCAIGPATRDMLRDYFIEADLVPEKFVAESVLDALAGKVKGKKILLPRAELARDVLPKGLENEGAAVTTIDLYHTTIPSGTTDELKKLIENTDLVTFASSSTVDNFVKILGADFDSVKGKIKAATIGPVTTQTAREHGLEIACEAREYTIPGLVDAIMNYYAEDGQ